MKDIILITNSFPFLPGEQFLETEVLFYKDNNLSIMPITDNIKKREINNSIKIDTYLIENKICNLRKVKLLINSLFSSLFYKELLINKAYIKDRIKSFIYSIIQYNNYLELFEKYFKNTDRNLENTIIYTYWNNEITYALQTLKSIYKFKLISRIHGYDIYQERHISNYIPLKINFTKNIDKIFTITTSANEYLIKNYGFNKELIELSRLGVINQNITTKASKKDSFNIVSCSFLEKVKRIDKIIDSIALIAENEKNIKYKWTHIGNGKLSENIEKKAYQKLNHLSNVEYKLMGNLTNYKVFKYYQYNEIDVFINVSESEGVPVSIMEAMSCKIPIIAPNIGGIKDMINDNKNGFLLNKNPDIQEISEALKNVSFFKKNITRESSYNIFLEKYDAKKNYNDFLETINANK